MIVRCIFNTGQNLPTEYLMPNAGPDRDTRFPLMIGHEYVVYAIDIHKGRINYYVCEELHLLYPMWYAASLFAVVDNAISKHWVYDYINDQYGERVWIAPKDWVSEPYFYDRLTDLEEDAVEKFRQIKELLDNEHS